MELDSGIPKRPLVTGALLAKSGLTAAFFVFFYLIWQAISGLEQQLKSNTDQFAAAHNLQVEYKLEVQEWKDLLLRSSDRASLDKHWAIFEQQQRKVADAATAALKASDVRAVNVKLQSFLDAHTNNLEQYRASTELLVKHGYDPQRADQAVKGIDRPLLTLLEEADEAMQLEKELIDGRLIAKARNRVEQALVALVLIALFAVWRPRS
jgi:methyl-accepting chemotaxis protein-1 (serine sensor receptor)